MSTEFLRLVLAEASRRFDSDLKEAMPSTATLIDLLLQRTPRSHDLGITGYSPRFFPTLSMPMWITPPEDRQADFDFHCDVAYSSLNGYYLIRLVDDAVDGDGPEQINTLLPAVGYFHACFQTPYMKYFPHDHAFWSHFRTIWAAQAEMSAVDAALGEITEERFFSVSAQKFVATKIPVAATVLRHRNADALPSWFEFVDRLGALFQMVNDFFDWHHDQINNNETYFLSEYRRRRRPDEVLVTWFVREGFLWGAEVIRDLLDKAKAQAERLDVVEAAHWLQQREERLEMDLLAGQKRLPLLAALHNALQPTNSWTP